MDNSMILSLCYYKSSTGPDVKNSFFQTSSHRKGTEEDENFNEIREEILSDLQTELADTICSRISQVSVTKFFKNFFHSRICEKYSGLSRCCTARWSSTGFSLVSSNKVKARKSFISTESSLY